MRLWRCTFASEKETAALGEALGAMLRAGDVLGLDGPLGAGKTTLTRSIAAGMGIDPRDVSSPTFVVVNEYEPRDSASGAALAHVDAYRLAGADDLDSVDWDRLIEPASGMAVVVEWASRIEEALPQQCGRIRMAPGEDPQARHIEILLPRQWTLPDRPQAARLVDVCGEPVKVTRCPITGVPTPTDSPTWPFATEQARMADLHRWFAGEYRLSRDATDEDLQD